MLKFTRLVAAAAIGAACAPLACAEFVQNNPVYIQGVAGPEGGYTYWGSNVDGYSHYLGMGTQVFYDSTNANFTVSVTSTVNSPTSVTFCFDFSNYNPGAYSLHAFEIIGLKNDGSLTSVEVSQGFAYIQDGNKVRWDGTGAGLAETPKILMTVEQVPAPGALALLGMAGLAGKRKRRS